MDTLTHALSGALCGRLVVARPGPGLSVGAAMVGGFLAGAFPDSDALLGLFTDPLTFLDLHRGVTHSLVLLPLWALLLSWVFSRLGRGAAVTHWFPLVALALLVHIAADVITSYGTQVLAPLSDFKASWPTTFIIDLWFSALVLAGVVGSVVWRRSRWPAAAALLLLLAYVGLQAVLMARAEAFGRAHAAGIAPEARVHALAQPLSPFHWKVIVETTTDYRVAHLDLWGDTPSRSAGPDASLFARIDALFMPPDELQWRRVSRFGDGAEARLARQAWSDPGFAGYRRFARFPYLHAAESEGERHCMWYADLRFAMGSIRVPFRYGLCREGGGGWEVFRWTEEGPVRVAGARG